jgi:hypothetical protein
MTLYPILLMKINTLYTFLLYVFLIVSYKHSLSKRGQLIALEVRKSDRPSWATCVVATRGPFERRR